MWKHKHTRVLLGLLVFGVSISWGAGDIAQRPSGFVKDLKTAQKLDAGRASLTGPRATKEADETTVEDLLHQWKDNEVFLEIKGHDRVRWGLIREQLEELLNGFKGRPEMGAEGLREAKKMAFRIRLQKLLRSYLKYAVIAAEARRLGLKVSHEEFEEQRRQARVLFERRGAAGAVSLKRMSQPESLYEHNLTNALLWQAYSEKILRPAYPIPDADVKQRVADQHRGNLGVLATNDYKRALIQDIHAKVKGGFLGRGKMDFAEAAAKWSDCNTSETGGVFLDENEQPQHIKAGDLCAELEAAYGKLKPGDISPVVETPHSWHILKLLARHPAKGDEPETVELAHIMLEKLVLQPELTEEQARKKLSNVKVRLALEEKFQTLLKTTKISCKIPLTSADSKTGTTRKKPLRRLVEMKK